MFTKKNRFRRSPQKKGPNFNIETDTRWVQAAKIISYIAIPVVIAIMGQNVQTTMNNNALQSQEAISKNALNAEYLNIATSILSTPAESTNIDIRNWAIDLINQYSPVAISLEAENQLKNFTFTNRIFFNSRGTTYVNSNYVEGNYVSIAPQSPISVGTMVKIVPSVNYSNNFNNNIRSIQIKIDNTIVFTGTPPGGIYTWDTSKYSIGTHIIDIIFSPSSPDFSPETMTKSFILN